MAGVAFAVEGDGVCFETESYAASALYTTLASLSGALWRIRRASGPLRSLLALCRRCLLLGRITDSSQTSRHVCFVPCVDGSELARAFFTFCSIGRCSHVFGL